MLHRIRAAANAAVAKLERRVLDWLLPHIVVVVDQEVTKAIEGLRDELEEHIEHVVEEKVEEAVDEKFDEFDFEESIQNEIRDSRRIQQLIKNEVRDALDGEELAETLHEWLVTHPQTANEVAEALTMHLPGLAQGLEV
jgi:predicted Holliday junction resolvase-like endonuclease